MVGPAVTILLSIDGGNRKATGRQCAVAEYHARVLYGLHSLNRAQAVKAEELTCDAVAVERPGYLKAKVPPRVIADLCWNAAAVAYTIARGAPVHEYTVSDGQPTDWIGTVPKPILHRRIWSALTGPERKVFPASTADDIERAVEHYARTKKILNSYPAYDWLCATGVGLFHFGRIKKGGVKV